MNKTKIQYIILFNTGKYWGGNKTFVQHWWQAHSYSTLKGAIRQAKHVILRRRIWYNNVELLSFSIVKKESVLLETVANQEV